MLLAAILLLTHKAAAVFFHEPSAIALQMKKDRNNATTSFGFSLGYQSGKEAKLVIGAPQYDQDGRVFQCPVKNIEKDKPCKAVNINFNDYGDLLECNRTLNPDQYFYLGASIAATKNGFVTCAPLRTTDTTEEMMYGAFGVCFAYNDADKTKAKLWSLHSNFAMVDGGAGWSTLVDEERDRIIISQFFTTRDTVTAKISKPDYYTMLINDADERSVIVDKMPIYGQAMTMGNYFDQDKSKTYYAFSMKTLDNKGAIDFFSTENLTRLHRTEDDTVGSMFGASLGSADVTGDGRAELFVGAPTHVTDATSYDRGAVHVYTAAIKSGELQSPPMVLKLTIWGVQDGARFGTTLSTIDVDGDSYPEIIVSAPFDESGGALYIICGYALNQLITGLSGTEEATTISVSDLKRTQIIRKTRSFGLSLQRVADYNENGSDELAVGSPEESTVTFYRGVRAITVNVSSEFKNEAAADEFEFVFSSCVTVQLPPKPNLITTRLLVKNMISGDNATFKDSAKGTYEIDLLTHSKCKGVGDMIKQCCKEFTIVSPYSCKVNTSVYLVKNIKEQKEFKTTWVTLSAQSVTSKTTKPACHCNRTTCVPEYTVELLLSGKSGSNHTYIVGSSEYETVSVIVRNTGTMGCGACADVRVSGSLDYTLPCDRTNQGYMCELPTPFRANTNKTIDIRLLTSTLSNQEKNLTIDVTVYKECDRIEAAKSSLLIAYDFSEVLENVIVNGFTKNISISDTELQDENEEMLPIEQTFTIFNNQSFTWKDVWVKVDAINKPYVKDFKIWMKPPMESCVESNETNLLSVNCPINLAQNSTTEITAYFTFTKIELSKFLWDGDNKIMITNLKLQLFPEAIKTKELATMVKFEREQTAGNNSLITIIVAFVVALLLLLLIAFILYKLNFFKRKNKEELEELKRELSHRSKRSATSTVSCAQREQAVAPAPINHDDTVDLIVDETPLDNSLTPAQLNALAAKSEPTAGSEETKSYEHSD